MHKPFTVPFGNIGKMFLTEIHRNPSMRILIVNSDSTVIHDRLTGNILKSLTYCLVIGLSSGKLFAPSSLNKCINKSFFFSSNFSGVSFYF